ncbi:LpxL/LpxP family Kdo(2)-lipid IV(A) lauroyl/palmitoleoyl acyltransferase [Celerinatantimonas yamalensis]|uniref:Lipid A biosynthesis acyltransferase n=1 Tax=Celerinatantimonas yamalensis TaxID=559956 RepID=A0ABW9GBI8_9GAMM
MRLQFLDLDGTHMAMIIPPRLSWRAFLPKHWGAWLIIAFLFTLSLLPTRLSWWLGRCIGRLAKRLLKSRRHIAQRNLKLCFPDASEQQLTQWVDETFERFGLAIIDTATAWFWPQKRFAKYMHVEGGNYLHKLREEDPKGGILVISMHFYTLEWHARMYGTIDPGVGVYRPNSNPVYEHFQHRARVRCNHYLVNRSDFRGMIKALRQGEALWYAPDHDYGSHKSSVFVPFFAVPKASTVTGTSALAKVPGVRLLISYTRRHTDRPGYTLVIKPLEGNYPSGDITTDAALVNQHIETAIKEQIPEYMWIHRRFKSRPEGEPSVY